MERGLCCAIPAVSLLQLHHVSLVIWLTHLLHTAAICFTGLSPGVETDVVNVTSGFLNRLLNFNGHHYNDIVFGKGLKAPFESVFRACLHERSSCI